MKKVFKIHKGKKVIKEVEDDIAEILLNTGWGLYQPGRKAKKAIDKTEKAIKDVGEGR